MMLFPFMRRTIRRSAPAGTIFSGSNHYGRFNFDRWGENEELRSRFELLISVSFYSPVPQATVLLEFVNPTPDPEAVTVTAVNTDRMVLLFDDSGTLTSFVENNEGAWWPVPWREKPDLPYELHFTTAAGDSAGDIRTLQVELAWIPRWPCAMLSDYLARLSGTRPDLPPPAVGSRPDRGSFSSQMPDPEG